MSRGREERKPGEGGGERMIRGITANRESRALNERKRGEPVAFRSYVRCGPSI